MAVLTLQLRIPPIFTCNETTADVTAALAFQAIVIATRQGVVVTKFFARRNIPHGDIANLPIETDICITGMIE